MIRKYTNEDIAQISFMWQTGFGDSSKYVDIFLKKFLDMDECYVYIDGGVPRSMLFVSNCEIIISGEVKKAAYVYGITTETGARCQGFAKKLVHYARELLLAEGKIAILVPSEKSLFDYYKNLGFCTSFYIRNLTVPASSDKIETSPVSAEEYNKIRNSVFSHDGSVLWDNDRISLAIEDIEFSGGSAIKVTVDSCDYTVICIPSGDTLQIVETTLPDNLVPSVAGALAAKFGCSSANVRLSINSQLGELVPFGMSDSPIASNGYLNLVFDL